MDLPTRLSADSSDADLDDRRRFLNKFDSIIEGLNHFYRESEQDANQGEKPAPPPDAVPEQELPSHSECKSSETNGTPKPTAKGVDPTDNPAPGFDKDATDADGHTTERHADDIYALLPDSKSIASLNRRLAGHGLSIHCFRNRAQLEIGLSTTTPAAVIVDDKLPGTIGLVRALRERLGGETQIIYLSANDTLEKQVKARDAGAAHYLTKPIKKNELVDCLRQATARGVAPESRVLVIADDKARALTYSKVLKGVGLDVAILMQPLDALRPLTELRPDVLLIDLSSSDFSAVALGASLRHHESGARLPIVYVGEPQDPLKQPTVFAPGSDDYVGRQVGDGYLAKLVVSRVRHAKFLSSQLSHDPLTGFWTESVFNKYFDAVLGIIMRAHSSLTAVVLDIDRFREINRRFGYASGDAALQSIASCILKRLRYSDMVCRYGRGRIAIALPGADPQSARKAVNDLREQIGGLVHVSGNAEFSVSVSAGVAGCWFDFNAGDMPLLAAQLVESADQALEVAKRRGGNCIEVYDANAGH
jgi:diguanylate cyclase (GGDEF)-like protein